MGGTGIGETGSGATGVGSTVAGGIVGVGTGLKTGRYWCRSRWNYQLGNGHGARRRVWSRSCRPFYRDRGGLCGEMGRRWSGQWCRSDLGLWRGCL